MARDWATWLNNATGPASSTEEADRDRTERRIKEAIAKDSRLAGDVRVFVKGSYRNGTNVRRDSDVDIAVMWNRWAYLDRMNDATEMSWQELDVSVHEAAQPPSPPQLREWVAGALTSAFGSANVDTTGRKAITVARGTTTLDADVVPCFEYQRYDRPRDPIRGLVIYPKDGSARIVNYPEQNYANGVSKNAATERRYKKIVRALKRLENDMVDTGRLPAPVHGYFIECLLYNLADDAFTVYELENAVLRVLSELWNAINDDQHRDWVELNGLKWLWRGGQTWTPDEAKTFAYNAWNYIKGNT